MGGSVFSGIPCAIIRSRSRNRSPRLPVGAPRGPLGSPGGAGGGGPLGAVGPRGWRGEAVAQAARHGQILGNLPAVLDVELVFVHRVAPADGVSLGQGAAVLVVDVVPIRLSDDRELGGARG